MSRSTSTTRHDLLQSAGKIILEQGSSSLTLDSVAQAAGVSKGGLLYHFPNKQALVEALCDHLLSDFDHDLEQRIAADPNQDSGTWLRAFVRATFDPDQPHLDNSMAILAALATDPGLLEPVRRRFQHWQDRLETTTDPTTSTIIRLAADGLWFADLLGFHVLTDHRRATVRDALIHLTEA